MLARSDEVIRSGEVASAPEPRIEAREGAFEELFRNEHAKVWRTVYAFTGGRRDIADDAVAEAFARALHRLQTIRHPVRWIYRAALNAAIDEIRSERRNAAEPDVQQAPTPESLLELMAALRRLPPGQRSAVVLHYQMDLPVAEVARRTGVSAATVRVHLHRARKRLRDLLGSEEEDDA